MGYDSLSGRTDSYVKDRKHLNEEFDCFDEAYGKLENVRADAEKSDADIQSAVSDIQRGFDQEHRTLEGQSDELEDEKSRLSDSINRELDRLDTASRKIDSLAGKEYAGGLKTASEMCEDYMKQLEGLLDRLDAAASAGNARGAAGGAMDGRAMPDGSCDGRTASDRDAMPVGSLVPDRKTPRDLPCTQYGFTVDPDGSSTYDSPMEMDRYLYKSQGAAYTNFQGTCGLCSIVNVMRLAGVNLSEKDVIDYAAKTAESDEMTAGGVPWANRLCVIDPFRSGASGGTNPRKRKKILEHFGISSGIFPVKMDGGTASDETIREIADYVAHGRGVILSVHASVLEPQIYASDLNHDFHAVTVTSVGKNRQGDISGFYICDSNRGTSFYPADVVRSALTGADMNVTYSYIR